MDASRPPSSFTARVRPGRREDLPPATGAWVFVDPGFSQSARSCGLLVGDGEPQALQFGALRRALVLLATSDGPALNLVLEAPLSIAFNAQGNPVGRRIERRDRAHRYWHAPLGASVLVSATHLLRAIVAAGPQREIRLFEGFVSFKPKQARSNHCDDVQRLRAIAWGDATTGTFIDAPSALRTHAHDVLESAFAVAGMDFGIPPVLMDTSTLEPPQR